MIRLVRIILISIALIVYCKQGTTQEYFSQMGLDYDSLRSFYKDVPLHGGIDIETFVVEIKDIEIDDQLKADEITGHVTCQPFVDERGDVETIFIIKSVDNYLDSLAIEALKKSKFKPLQMSSKLSKYSCMVKYYFKNGLLICPSVNGIVINVPEKLPSELTKKPEESAIESLYQWKFTPGENEGRPVKVWMKVPIDYRIKR